MAQRAASDYRDGCAEADAIEDGLYGRAGSSEIVFVRGSRGKWDKFFG
jgi:hypothetical protein